MRHRVFWVGLLALAVVPGSLHGQSQSSSRSGPKVGYIHKDFELHLDADVAVRTDHPPARFDENGKPRKYTDTELKALRGPDRGLPGFDSDFSRLRKGQVVKVYLAWKKDPPAGGDRDLVARDAGQAPARKGRG